MIKRILIIAAVVVLLIAVFIVVRLLLLKRDIAQYREYWQQRADADIPDNALIYVALGDSAAQGLGASRPENGYVGLVADHIAKKTNKPVHVINLSVSGAKVRDVIDTQIPKLSDFPKPDILTIEIGANDMLSYDKEQFKKDYDELLPPLPANTVISNLPSFAGSRFNHLNKYADEANEYLDSILGDSSLEYVDLNTATEGLGLGDFASDFFHPNDRSYKRWARAFIAGIDKKI